MAVRLERRAGQAKIIAKGDETMSRPEDDAKPEPGTDDARSSDSEASRHDREQTKKNAERMIEQRHGSHEGSGEKNA